MKKITLLTLLFFLTLPISLFSQEEKTLYKKMKVAVNDAEKISMMIQVGQWHLKHYGKVTFPKSADSVWYYANKAEKLATAIKKPDALGKSYIFFSQIHYNNIDYTKASLYAQKAIKLFEKTTDKAGLCEAYNAYLLAEIESIPLNNKFLEFAQKCLELCRTNNQKSLEAQTIENIGYYYSRLGDLQKELEYLEEAVVRYKKIGNQTRLKGAYPSMAASYAQLGNIDKALKYNLEAIAILKQDKEHVIMDSFSYGTIGDTYSALNDMDNAIIYCKEALKIATQYSNKNYQALCETSLLDMLQEKGNISQAKVHFNNIEGYLNTLDPIVKADAGCTLLMHSVYYNYRSKADKYAKLAIKQLHSKDSFLEINRRMHSALMKYYFYIKDYANSKLHALDYKKMAEEASSLNRLERAHMQLAKIDSAQGNLPDYIKNFRIAVLYKDSIQTEDRNMEMARLETEYKMHEKENDYKILKQQHELQNARLSQATIEKKFSAAGIILLIIIVALIYIRYRANQKMRKQTSQKNIILENLLTEKEWLIKEIHHRVKNNLQVVISLLNTQLHFLDDKTAIDAIKNSKQRIYSMSLIHKKLYQSDNIVSLNMKDYINELIEYFKIAFETGERIKFVINVAPIALSPAQAVPCGLIINEAVSNALKHGFPNERKGIIHICMEKIDDTMIKLSVKDNGIGNDQDTESTNLQSLGMKLIKGFSGELNAELQIINNEGMEIILTFMCKVA